MLDRSGRSQLHYAAAEDRVEDVQRLLADGVDPNLQDCNGASALHFAAQEFAVQAAGALIEGGANVDAADKFGNTPLFTAAFNSRGRGELIRLLRAAGADPSHVNRAGQTPVGVARLIANYDVAQHFADLPARVTLPDAD